MAPLPHYLRFARAAALVTGLATLPGCYASHVRDSDDAPDAQAPDAAPIPDAAPVDAHRDDAFVDVCDTCECTFGTTDPTSCEALGYWRCCPVVGPLSPPDLAL
jgi:hypothetical protein